MFRSAALATLSTLLLVGSAPAQEEGSPPPEPPEEASAEQAPDEEEPDEKEPGETAESLGEQEPTEEPAPGEEPDPEQPAEEQEEAQEPELTPEERAAIEEARRKREERQAKREAKEVAEKAKAAEKAAKEEAKHREQLAKILDKGFEAIDRGELKNALQAFQTYTELAGKDPFPGYMGLARTQLAMGEPARAIERALEAAKLAVDASDEAEALVFAGDASLAARPRDEISLQPLPGTELYETTALRFYLRALAADPEDGSEALTRLEKRFPTPPDESTERLYDRYLEMDPTGPALHAKRLAAAYEALISGRATSHVAVTGGITPPVKISGPRPPYPLRDGGKARRLVAGLHIDADGTVSRVKVLNGTDAKLDRKASEVLGTWTFEPARLPGGVAVPVHYAVAVNAVEPPEEELDESEIAETGPDEPDDQGDPEPDP